MQSRLLQAREGVVQAVGRELAVAIESHDRFMLANRWLLCQSPEHAVERNIWPLLSYQAREHVLIECARHEYDALVDFVFHRGAGALLQSGLQTYLNSKPTSNFLREIGDDGHDEQQGVGDGDGGATVVPLTVVLRAGDGA